MRRRQNPQCHPTASFHRHLKRHFALFSISHDRLARDGHAIHDDFDGHFPRITNPRTFDAPVRLFEIAGASHPLVGLIGQSRRYARRQLDGAAFRQLQLAPLLAHAHRRARSPIAARRHQRSGKFQQVTATISHVVSTRANAFAPRLVTQFVVELHVAAPKPHAFVIDAREIRLATNARTKSGIQRMIPHVQFPDVRRGDRRHEIHRRHELAVRSGNFVRHVHDVLIGANAAVFRQSVVGQITVTRLARIRRLQSPTRMGRSDERALLLRPAQRIQPKRWPVL